MRVLVTSSRNPFAVDIIRKLGSEGHTVVATDTYHGAMGSHSKYAHAHAVTASPTFDTDAFIADVVGLVNDHEIEVIVPSFEEAFYLAARAHDLPDGVRLYAGAFDKLARLHDKASFQRLVEEAGVPIPETIVATDDPSLAAAIEKFPKYFARAAFSRGGVALLTNTGPLAAQMSVEDCHPTPDQPWLVQPFIDGPMVCTYSTIVNGRVTPIARTRLPSSGRTAQASPSSGPTARRPSSTCSASSTRSIPPSPGSSRSTGSTTTVSSTPSSATPAPPTA